jgi:hypothetical protein
MICWLTPSQGIMAANGREGGRRARVLRSNGRPHSRWHQSDGEQEAGERSSTCDIAQSPQHLTVQSPQPLTAQSPQPLMLHAKTQSHQKQTTVATAEAAPDTDAAAARQMQGVAEGEQSAQRGRHSTSVQTARCSSSAAAGAAGAEEEAGDDAGCGQNGCISVANIIPNVVIIIIITIDNGIVHLFRSSMCDMPLLADPPPPSTCRWTASRTVAAKLCQPPNNNLLAAALCLMKTRRSRAATCLQQVNTKLESQHHQHHQAAAAYPPAPPPPNQSFFAGREDEERSKNFSGYEQQQTPASTIQLLTLLSSSCAHGRSSRQWISAPSGRIHH